jgi:hypothetical protein
MRHIPFNKRLLLLGLLLLLCTMVLATQFAVTQVSYDFNIVHPSNANIRLIGSDNASDNIRLLRVAGSNTTNIALRLALGNYTMNQTNYYTAAFGIVNEENYSVNITHINVSSTNCTYMTIRLHGNRDANANTTLNDPTMVLMYRNGTVIHPANISAWTLAAGNHNPNDMCSNITNRTRFTIPTPWDPTSHVHWSRNETNTSSNYSDFVWVQIDINIPPTADYSGLHQGVIYIHFKADNA